MTDESSPTTAEPDSSVKHWKPGLITYVCIGLGCGLSNGIGRAVAPDAYDSAQFATGLIFSIVGSIVGAFIGFAIDKRVHRDN